MTCRNIAKKRYAPKDRTLERLENDPIEHLWEHIRESGFRNRAFASTDDLEDELERILKDLDNDKETVQSITGFHWAVLDA